MAEGGTEPEGESEDYPRTPEGHIDFEKMLEEVTLADLDADESMSVEEAWRELGTEPRAEPRTGAEHASDGEPDDD